MKKKKSYMNTKNIMNEGAIGNFLRGLFTGNYKSQKDAVRLKTKIDKNVKKFNQGQSDLEKLIYKDWGEKVKLDRMDTDDIIDNAR